MWHCSAPIKGSIRVYVRKCVHPSRKGRIAALRCADCTPLTQ